MNIEESDLFSAVLDTGDRIGYVPIGESHRGCLGSGTVDFDSFFRALERIGYGGPITFESFSTAVVDETLSRSLAVWRNLWDDSDDLGIHASTFIRSKMRAVETISLHRPTDDGIGRCTFQEEEQPPMCVLIRHTTPPGRAYRLVPLPSDGDRS